MPDYYPTGLLVNLLSDLPGHRTIEKDPILEARVMSFPCRAVLFDLDGVLVHSAGPIRRSWIRWAAVHGLDITIVEEAAHGRRAVDAIRLVTPHLDAESVARQMDDEQAADTAGVIPVAGAPALVSSLHRGEWAVVTSGRRTLAEARMRAASLPQPPVLICAEDVREGKPSPEGYQSAAKALDKDPDECVVIEDAAAGVAAARLADMRVVGLAPPNERHRLAAADAIVRSCADIVVERVDSSATGAGGLLVHVKA